MPKPFLENCWWKWANGAAPPICLAWNFFDNAIDNNNSNKNK